MQFVVSEKFTCAYYTKLQEKSCRYLLITYMKKLLRKSRQTKFESVRALLNIDGSKEDERRGGLGSGVGRVDMRCPSLREWDRGLMLDVPPLRSGVGALVLDVPPIARVKRPQYRGVIIKNHLTRSKCFLMKRLAAHPKFVELRKIRDERSRGGEELGKSRGEGWGFPYPSPSILIVNPIGQLRHYP